MGDSWHRQRAKRAKAPDLDAELQSSAAIGLRARVQNLLHPVRVLPRRLALGYREIN